MTKCVVVAFMIEMFVLLLLLLLLLFIFTINNITKSNVNKKLN